VSELRTGSGNRVRITTVLGKGGEGIVYHIDGDSTVAAKIYLRGSAPARREKVQSMIRAELFKRYGVAAFPIDTLFDERKEFVGFTMRKVANAKPIHELYAPGSRKLEFQDANFQFLARAARNTAAAVASVHHAGCVIGDINHSGFLVDQRATVTLIDADSFQFHSGAAVYRCLVGASDYTPPELRGAALEKVDRVTSHDGFGLAVIVFQLLFMGRHPFAGRFTGQGEMPIEAAIKDGRFAYSLTRRTETRLEPPPFAPTLADVTPEVADLFERAFTAKPASFMDRPGAVEWLGALSRFEATLVVCRSNSAHHHPKACPTCPWCRLEAGTGATLFLSSETIQRVAARGNFDLDAAMAAIERVLGPGAAPDPSASMPITAGLTPSPGAVRARAARRDRRTWASLIGVASILLMLNGIPAAFFGLLVAGALAIGGGNPLEPLVAAKVSAERVWQSALRDWQHEVGPSRFDNKKAELIKLAAEHRALIAHERHRLAVLEQERPTRQLTQFLERHLIAKAEIDGIKQGRKATLASYGIETAADVTQHQVRTVPGFGRVLTQKLMDWRNSMERGFVFDPAIRTDPKAIQQVKDEIATRRAELNAALERGPFELEQLRTQTLAARAHPTARLTEAHRALRQAEVDLA